jgi:signal transduction histidine kinase
LIQVWDTGIGIVPEHIDLIFDEYFQVGNPERDNAKGLGLGLSIAKRLAQALGSRISCRSRLGKGTVFGFCVRTAETTALLR